MSERERLDINADVSLRLVLDLLIAVDQVDTLPANCLKVLGHLALQPDGSADQAAVQAELKLSTDQMSRVSEKLHEQHLLRRRELESDRRAYRLSITPKGRGEVGALNKATQSVVLKFANAQLSRSGDSRDPATK